MWKSPAETTTEAMLASDSGHRSAVSSEHWRSSRLRTAVVLCLIALGLLAPIWTVHYVPIGDYSNHLASAFVLAHLNDPQFSFHAAYASDWNTFPYLTMDAILLLLQKVFSIALAGRLLLSLCVLAVPAAAWWFLREANPSKEMLAVWTLITAQNMYFFLNGFINMQLSLALCLVVLGAWVRWLRNPRAVSWCVLMAAVTALYFTHLMGLAVAGLVVTTYTLASRKPLRKLLLGWALFIPAVGFYWHAERHLATSWNITFRPLGEKFVGLLGAVIGFSPALDFFTLVAAGLCWVWASRGNRSFRWQAPWAASAGLLFALYWIFPAAYGPGLNADRRLLPFIVAVGLASVKLGPRLKPVAVVALALFFIRASALEYRFVSLQPRLETLIGAGAVIPAGSRVLPLVPFDQGLRLVESQLWAYGVIEHGWISPCLFHDPGVQPFAIKLKTYIPYAPPSCSDLKEIDWARVRHDYDYLWAFQTPEYEDERGSAARLLTAVDGLRLYRVDRTPGVDSSTRNALSEMRRAHRSNDAQ